MKQWLEYEETIACGETVPDNKLPPSYRVYVQGNPGSGKSFVIHTIRNIVRNLTKSMEHDLATAPTGCAASLFRGQTAPRALKYKCGKKGTYGNLTDDISASSAQAKINFIDTIQKMYVYLKDEHSMDGRSDFAWQEHRFSHIRRLPGGHVDPRIAER